MAQPTANPSQTTTYTLTMSPTSSVNLLQNGNFESGNTGFSSDYLLHPNSLHDNHFGRYAITSNPQSISANWCSISNHTQGGSLMFVAEGSIDNDDRMWYQNVSVLANTNYYFSGFAYAISDPNPIGSCPNLCENPVLNVQINGSAIISNLTISYQSCSGSYIFFEGYWNSGNNNNALIEIRSSSIARTGNDIALDDLHFGTCTQSTDQVTVFVATATPAISPIGPITYYNQYETPNSITLTASSSGSYQWYKNNNPINGATNQTYVVEFQGNSTYTDYYKCTNACGTSNTVTFNYIPCDDASDYPVSVPGLICNSQMTSPSYYQLSAPSLGGGTSYSWWLYNPLHSVSTCYAINGSGQLTAAGCDPYETDGVYTKSTLGSAETYMFYVIGNNAGCRMINPPNTIPVKAGSVKTKSPSGTPVIANAKGEKVVSLENTLLKPEEKASLFPNPAKTEVSLIWQKGISKVEIYNNMGMLAGSITGNEKQLLTITVATYPPGLYVLKLTGTNKELETLKLLIQR